VIPAELEQAAIAHFQAGRFAEAEKAFAAILEHDPAHTNALHALGVLAMRSQRFAEAAAFLRRAAAQDASSFGIAYNLGSALRQAGELDEARAAFSRAVQIDPRSADAHLGLGNTLRQMGDTSGARESFTLALRANGALVAAEYNLALLDIEQGRPEAAAAGLRRVVARDTSNADAWNHLGLLAQGAEKVDEAIELYRRALQARPAFAGALANWGNALKDRGDLAGALELYEKALEADPNEAGVLVNRASVAAELGDVAQARRANLRALEARPGYAEARYALSLLDLREHDFERGWDGYESRFETTPPAAVIAPPHRPRAQGIAGFKRLAVRMEQGLGDQLLFSTLLTELRDRRIEAVVEIDARLASALRRSFAEFEFAAPGQIPAALAACDREIPLGSLPRLFRASVETFRRQPAALLQAEASRVGAIRETLGAGRHIAISWRSFQAFGRRHIATRKSIPLDAFGALAEAGVRLLDLQYGDASDERAQFDRRHPGLRVEVPGLDVRNDIEGVLAAIEVCDLVITSSNVTAHFAGALGKPTWLLYLAANPPFHYWSAGPDGRSLWYPSVEIVTDARWTRWETVFEAVAERLRRSRSMAGGQAQ
jgi:tetratricopeptide (TPR) repeat protein